MKVINIHSRVIDQPKEVLSSLFDTLASKNDQLLATDKWPAMYLDQGLAVGSKGGHGTIRYTVEQYTPGESIQFRFTRPKGFDGFHKFKICHVSADQTELRHEINMQLRAGAILTWPLMIRHLHDAYIEDAFDRVENHFRNEKKTSKWTPWVRFLRAMFTIWHKKNTLLKGAF